MHISLDSALGQQRRLNSVGESITQIAPDPAAAYSLRSLTGGDPKVVRVRRASDNHEQDFTASDVSSGALQDFVNAQVVAPLDIQALSATGRDGDFLIAKAAYSLRSLGTRQATLAATGDTVARANGKFVCQVRRSTDDALKSFTATEITDGTLLSFVGTGGSDNGFVKTWYDQSVTTQAGDTATGNHAVQGTAASQPKIVNAGALIADGLTFDGSDDSLSTTSAISSTNIAIACVSKSANNATAGIFSMLDGFNDGHEALYLAGEIRIASNSSDLDVSATITNQNLYFANYDGSTQTLSSNGVASTQSISQTISVSSVAQIGSRAGGNLLNGSIEEIIVYTSDQTDNRTAIEANLGEVYSIDLPSGVDPGFDQVDGFVETWYDQSGNVPPNDAVQTTASLQPKIVDAGSLITMNGKPAFKFTSSSSSYFNMTSELSGISDFSTFFVSEVVDRSGRGIIVAKDHLNYLRMRDVDFQLEASNTDSGAIAFNSVLTDGGQFSLAFIRASNTLTAYVAGAAQSNTVSISDNLAVNKLFGRNVNFQTWVNKAQELIFYTSDQTANVSTLNTNMASHYEIS
jgi:hypothetical protein